MRNSHCSMLLHNEGGGGHATEHSANHAAIMSGGDVSDGASSAEGERSARQRGGANGTGRFLKPFFFGCLCLSRVAALSWVLDRQWLRPSHPLRFDCV